MFAPDAESVAKMDEEASAPSASAEAPTDPELEEWAQRSVVGRAKRKLAAKKGLKERRVRNAKRK